MSKADADAVLKAISEFGSSTGQYWSKDNADFEATNPGIRARLDRAVDPATGFGFGPALGAWHDGWSNGSLSDIALGAIGSIPASGAMRPVQGMLAKAGQMAPSMAATLSKFGLGTAIGVGGEEAQARYRAADAAPAYEDMSRFGQRPVMEPRPPIPEDTKLNFEQRVLKPSQYPVMKNKDGSHSTHLMAWGESGDKYVAFPTIVQDQESGQLVKLDPKTAFGYAMQTKEFREFDHAAAAEKYAEGDYKKSWGKGEK